MNQVTVTFRFWPPVLLISARRISVRPTVPPSPEVMLYASRKEDK